MLCCFAWLVIYLLIFVYHYIIIFMFIDIYLEFLLLNFIKYLKISKITQYNKHNTQNSIYKYKIQYKIYNSKHNIQIIVQPSHNIACPTPQ